MFEPLCVEDLKNLLDEGQPIKNISPKYLTSLQGAFYLRKDLDWEFLEDWDVSHIQDFRHCFCCCDLSGHSIRHWDMSSARQLDAMFYASNVRSPLLWKLGEVSMKDMFKSCCFLSRELIDSMELWNPSSVTNAHHLFSDSNVGKIVTFSGLPSWYITWFFAEITQHLSASPYYNTKIDCILGV